MSKVVEFQLSDHAIGSILDNPEKFLGSQITYHGKQNETFDFVKTAIQKSLTNIDSTNIREEYKLRVYSQYLLPAIRYKLTVHDITRTNLDRLDAMCDRYIKKWLKMPPSGTLAIIHCQEGLNIHRLSHIYEEAHAVSHASSRMKGDSKVNQALDSRLERESQWSRKGSVTLLSENHYLQATSTIPSEDHTGKYQEKVKNKIKDSVNNEVQTMWKDHIRTLTVQGRFLELVALEESALTWRSIMFNLPRGILQFAVNAGIDTLATNANLKRWGKRSTAKCSHCKSRETLHHTLNNCPVMLDRYLWRHNSVLWYLFHSIRENADVQTWEVSVDLPGHHKGNTTVPVNVTVTTLKPDMVLYSAQNNEVILFELTVPFETNADNAHSMKVQRYQELINDIESKGIRVFYYATEIGSRGYINKDNIQRLKDLLKQVKFTGRVKDTMTTISKISLLSSFVIFHSKFEEQWINPPYISV